jgi:hypothetical protein
MYCTVAYRKHGVDRFALLSFTWMVLHLNRDLTFSRFSQSLLESAVNTRKSWPRRFLYTLRNFLETARDAEARYDRIPIDGASRPELYSCKDFELRISRIGCVLQACLSGHSSVLCVPYTVESSGDKCRSDAFGLNAVPSSVQHTSATAICCRGPDREQLILQTSLHILTICTAATVPRGGASLWVTFAGMTSSVFLVPWVRTSFHLDVSADCKFELLRTVTPTMTVVTFRVKTSVWWHPPIFSVSFTASCCLSQLSPESYCFKHMLYISG